MTGWQMERLLHVIIEIGRAIGSEQDLSTLLARISKLVCPLFEADACSIMLPDANDQCLGIVAGHGIAPDRIHRISFPLGQGVAGWVMATGRPALIDDVFQDARYARLPDSASSKGDGAAESMMCVPLVSRGQRIGVMTVTTACAGAFAQDDIDLFGAIANTIAMHIENTHLQRRSITDALTGAFNREYLRQNLPRAIAAAIRRGWPLSVVMIDVDHFKSINDRFGHMVGDQVLASVAQRLRSTIRDDDMIVRYGGEEFLAVLPKADRTQAWEIGERMRLKIQDERVRAGGTVIPVHVSLGIAEHRHRGRDIEHWEALIQRADQAMYLAKKRGRNRVEVFPDVPADGEDQPEEAP